ncbi:MAG: hypothetical protein FJW39_34000 [Acidobacteria bacterium]|nr:hypothetical protein [Acidobacteriota bacterium]
MLSPLDRFRVADWSDQARMLEDEPDVAQAVQEWLGPDAFNELRALDGGGRHLSAGKSNLIVVPGVMGSILHSEGLGGVWWVDMLRARDQLNKLGLEPDGLTDAEPGAAVEACGIDITYVPLRAAIAHSGDFGGTRQFPYDWRKPLAA